MTVLIDNRTDWVLDDEFERLFNDVVLESLKFEDFDTQCEVSISIVDNSEIKNINKQFRHIDKETDVFNFPYLTF